MNRQQACAKQHTDGFKPGRLPGFFASMHCGRDGSPSRPRTPRRGVPTLFTLSLLAAGMMAGTAYGQKATGGTSTNLVGAYWVHTFTTVGTVQFTPSEDIGVQYLVVGGGGGGGHGNGGTYCSGGGGAGGLITSVIGCRSGGGTPGVGSTPSLPAVLTASTAYTVTVGGGGPGASTEGPGTSGNDSVFGNVGNEFARAKGGGGGGRGGSVFSGGSGGGGGGYSSPPGAGTPNQGFAGGYGYGDFGGGGGGALNVGGNSGGNGGNGGPGQTNSITGAWVAYAGGGGGGNGGNSGGTGGSGVGGNGGGNNPGTDGRGGGGGGGNNGQGGKGGSGIVIIRYKDGTNAAPAAVGKNIMAYISSNKVTVTAQELDNGSSDADGDPLLYKINGQDSVTFTQANLGPNTVTLTVYDGFGGSSSCQQTVTVLGGGGDFKASGGDAAYIYTNFPGTASQVVYRVHVFTTVGNASFIPTDILKGVEYLVVGGGGGGGYRWGTGGGGAGGLITSVSTCYSGGGTPGVGSAPNNTVKLTAGTTYSVAVGGGGAGGAGSSSDGQDSVFGNTGAEFARAKGGGRGGNEGANGQPGGSGGGGGNNQYSTGGTGTVNQGFAGGGKPYKTGDDGGGGGGAGEVGHAAPSPVGGAGLANTITGNSVVYAGGGGGGSGQVHPGGGGAGGGGSGGNGGNGTDGLGGGGGGGSGNPGGKGGSGIVIVRYSYTPPGGTVVYLR